MVDDGGGGSFGGDVGVVAFQQVELEPAEDDLVDQQAFEGGGAVFG